MMLEDAKKIAVRYLAARMRSEHELISELIKKQVPEQFISDVLAYCRRYEWLNDERFAVTFIKSALLERNKGLYWIRYELKRKGISQDLMDQCLNQFDPQTEFNQAYKFAMKNATAGNTLSTESKRKLYQQLSRRGYSLDTVQQVMERFDCH